MNVVLDTHAWLWWIAEPARLSSRARSAIESADGVGVSTISCWEIATLARRERIRLDRDIGVWLRHAVSANDVEPIALTSDIAIAAGLLDISFPGDPADRLIYATAMERDASLITRDRAIRTFDRRRTIW